MMLKHLKVKKGSSPIWTIVIAIVLISFSLLIYTGMTLQSQYRQAQMEIERASHVSLNANLENRYVRDTEIITDLSAVKQSLEANLLQIGYEKEDENTWHRHDQNRVIYSIKHLSVEQDDEKIILNGILTFSLLNKTGDFVEIPFSTSVQALFIDF